MLNLDGLTPEQLEEAAQVFRNLEAYAKTKAWAMRDMRLGEVEDAKASEEQCERYYQGLPDWAKWRG